MKKRLTATLLCLCMALTLLPATAFAAEEYTLTMTGQSSISGIENTSAQIGSDVIEQGSSGSVAPGATVSLGCSPADGYLFKGWTVDPAGAVSVEDLCGASFEMPESDVTLSANVEELTPNFQMQDGVATWDAAEGYQSKLDLDPAPAGVTFNYLNAENGKYTYDLQRGFQLAEYLQIVVFGVTDTSYLTGDYSLGLSYAKSGEEQGRISSVGTFHYEAGQLTKLETPSNLRWDGFTARWDAVGNAGRYRVTFTETLNGSSQSYGSVSYVTGTSCDLTSVTGRTPVEGATYSFTVRAYGAEETFAYLPGDESQSSPASEVYQLPDEPVDYNLVVAGVDVTSENAADILDDGKVSYVPDTKTLTLNNAVLNSGIYRSSRVDGDDLTVNLIGENTIDITDTYGISLGANALFLQGGGTLKIIETGDMGQQGIWAKKVTIDGITLSINSGSSCIYAEANYGVAVEDGDETVNIVNGAELTLVSSQSAAISAKEISINGSTVTATTNDDSHHALYAWGGGIEIGNSTVNAYAESSASPAVWADDSVGITGGSNVTAICGEDAAVYTNGALTADGSTVNVSGNIALYSAGGNMMLTNATVNITDTTGTAIFSPYEINISGGAINGGSGDGYTIYSTEAVTVKDGAVLDIQSGTYGIASYEPVTLENVSGTIAVDNAAIWAIGNDIVVKGCKLTLKGSSTVNAGNGQSNLAAIQITDSELGISGVTPLYVAGDMTIMDSELTVTATQRPIVANYGTLTIDGEKTNVQAAGGWYISGTGVDIRNGNVNVSVTVPEDSTQTSMGAIYASTGGISISGGTVNASIGGKEDIRKVALITGGDLNITGGITTLRGDYPIFISANGGGSLSFGGTQWYQWADSALETPVMSTETPYTYAFSRNKYLRIEPIGTTYSLTVEGGEGSGSYTAGSEVSISAEPYNGQGHFSEWTVTDADAGDILKDSTAAGTTIIMPAANVTATANYASHVPEEHKGKAPTCTEEGSKAYYSCSCGKFFEDEACTKEIADIDTWRVIAPLDHSFTDYVYNNDATCTTDGTETAKCDRCDETDTRVKTGSALGHKTVKTEAKEATCTSEGYTGDKVCKDCGEVLEKGEIIPKLAHSYKNGTCTACGASDPDYKPAVSAGEKDSADKSASPRTGDDSSMMLWIPILAASGCAVTGIIAYRRRRKY